jgi:hypothetical protein
MERGEVYTSKIFSKNEGIKKMNAFGQLSVGIIGTL